MFGFTQTRIHAVGPAPARQELLVRVRVGFYQQAVPAEGALEVQTVTEALPIKAAHLYKEEPFWRRPFRQQTRDDVLLAVL